MIKPELFDLLVWWLCTEDLRAIFRLNINKVSVGRAYINQELVSCLGRNGRGRLWVNQYIIEHYGEDIEVKQEYWDSSYFNGLGNRLAEDYAGIVIRKEDYKFIKDYPGIITDLALDRWPDYRILERGRDDY